MTLILTLTSSIPSFPSLSVYDTKIASHVAHLPRIGNSLSKSLMSPFRQGSHRPPHSADDEYAGSSWLADWTWLKVAFSSSITVDEDRALLPPLNPRQPVYCYYDATAKKPAAEKDAESELLLTWRRAWWARGFRPVILSAVEALNNPSYDILQRLNMNPDLKADLMRWLAWDTMDGGILAHYTLLPIVSDEDALLTYLRRGEFPHLTRWQDLQGALFVGQKEHVKSALQAVMNADPKKLSEARDIMTGVLDEVIQVETNKATLAAYTSAIITQKYPRVAETLATDKAAGLISLNNLMTTHLHVAWQNRFPNGIEVLKPRGDNMNTLIANALQLAKQLAYCSDSPMPGTCPPNMAKCTPCVAMTPMTITTPIRYSVSSDVFSIGTVPHPWTLTLLKDLQQSFNVSWLLQQFPRDPWITASTQNLLGTGVSSTTRLVSLKELVAGEHASSRSLWVAAEKDMPSDMSWYFGFALPAKSLSEGQAVPPVPDFRRPEKDKTPHRESGPVVSLEERAAEQPLIDEAKRVVSLTKPSEETKLRASLEAWNMADTEIWKFVRAFQSRRHQERELWEKSEAKYNGGSGTEKGRSAWNRWQDGKSTAQKV